jgi:hypothetical protein
MPPLRAPASIERDRALDEAVGPDEADLPPDDISDEEPAGFRPVRALALWLSMAVLGVLLAFGWRYVGAPLWSDTQGWLAFAAGSTSTGTNRVENPLGRIAGELDAVKKKLDELSVSQQQTAAKVSSLQAAQQELQRRQSSFEAARWYSNSTLLTYPTAAAKKPPAAAASPRQTSTARVPSQAPDADNGRRSDGEPLSLSAPRP